jgi:hypothetical protein
MILQWVRLHLHLSAAYECLGKKPSIGCETNPLSPKEVPRVPERKSSVGDTLKRELPGLYPFLVSQNFRNPLNILPYYCS